MNERKAVTCVRVQVSGFAPIAVIAFRSVSLPVAPPPIDGGRLTVLESPSEDLARSRLPPGSDSFWVRPPNPGPEGLFGVLFSTVDLDTPDIAVSSGDRNNQGKRPEVTLPL